MRLLALLLLAAAQCARSASSSQSASATVNTRETIVARLTVVDGDAPDWVQLPLSFARSAGLLPWAAEDEFEQSDFSVSAYTPHESLVLRIHVLPEISDTAFVSSAGGTSLANSSGSRNTTNSLPRPHPCALQTPIARRTTFVQSFEPDSDDETVDSSDSTDSDDIHTRRITFVNFMESRSALEGAHVRKHVDIPVRMFSVVPDTPMPSIGVPSFVLSSFGSNTPQGFKAVLEWPVIQEGPHLASKLHDALLETFLSHDAKAQLRCDADWWAAIEKQLVQRHSLIPWALSALKTVSAYVAASPMLVARARLASMRLIPVPAQSCGWPDMNTSPANLDIFTEANVLAVPGAEEVLSGIINRTEFAKIHGREALSLLAERYAQGALPSPEMTGAIALLMQNVSEHLVHQDVLQWLPLSVAAVQSNESLFRSVIVTLEALDERATDESMLPVWQLMVWTEIFVVIGDVPIVLDFDDETEDAGTAAVAILSVIVRSSPSMLFWGTRAAVDYGCLTKAALSHDLPTATMCDAAAAASIVGALLTGENQVIESPLTVCDAPRLVAGAELVLALASVLGRYSRNTHTAGAAFASRVLSEALMQLDIGAPFPYIENTLARLPIPHVAHAVFSSMDVHTLGSTLFALVARDVKDWRVALVGMAFADTTRGAIIPAWDIVQGRSSSENDELLVKMSTIRRRLGTVKARALCEPLFIMAPQVAQARLAIEVPWSVIMPEHASNEAMRDAVLRNIGRHTPADSVVPGGRRSTSAAPPPYELALCMPSLEQSSMLSGDHSPPSLEGDTPRPSALRKTAMMKPAARAQSRDTGSDSDDERYTPISRSPSRPLITNPAHTPVRNPAGDSSYMHNVARVYGYSALGIPLVSSAILPAIWRSVPVSDTLPAVEAVTQRLRSISTLLTFWTQMVYPATIDASGVSLRSPSIACILTY